MPASSDRLLRVGPKVSCMRNCALTSSSASGSASASAVAQQRLSDSFMMKRARHLRARPGVQGQRKSVFEKEVSWNPLPSETWLAKTPHNGNVRRNDDVIIWEPVLDLHRGWSQRRLMCSKIHWNRSCDLTTRHWRTNTCGCWRQTHEAVDSTGFSP